MTEFDILSAAAAGMDAQRVALDVAARNVAAAQATPDHKAFERLVPRFAVGAPSTAGEPHLGDASTEPFVDTDSTDALQTGTPLPDGDAGGDIGPDAQLDGGFGPATEPAVRYLGTRVQRGVDVDAVTEMVAVLDAQRAYESNASVFDVGKRLAERTIDMGRLS